MDLEERLQQRLDNDAFQRSVAFDFPFFFLQLVFSSVIICALVAATH
jgi:hypothetical protein